MTPEERQRRFGRPDYRTCTSADCRTAVVIKHMDKQKKLKKKVERAEMKEAREKLKSVTVLHRELRTVVQKIVRHIDKGLPCICTNQYHEAYDGGHYLAAGSNPQAQHNAHNIHKCSVLSNQWRSGDERRFRLGLIKRYGEDYFNMVDTFHQLPHLKMSKDEIRAKKKIAQAIFLELKEVNFEGHGYYVRYLAREYVNQRIGIY